MTFDLLVDYGTLDDLTPAQRDRYVENVTLAGPNSRFRSDVPEVPLRSDFTPFDPVGYEELSEVPPMHLDYLVEQQDSGLPALGFVFGRHVLVAGAVDVAGLERTRLA